MCLKYQKDRMVTEGKTCIIMSPTLSRERSQLSATQPGVPSGSQPVKWLADSICKFNLCHPVVHGPRFFFIIDWHCIRPTMWMSAKHPSGIQPPPPPLHPSPPPTPPLLPQWLFKVDICHFRIKEKTSNSFSTSFFLFHVAFPDAISIPSCLACLSIH